MQLDRNRDGRFRGENEQPVRTGKDIARGTTIEPVGKVPASLGWTGSCFVDEHADGSRSIYWRVRMIDGDMTSGEVRAQIDRLEFRLLAK